MDKERVKQYVKYIVSKTYQHESNPILQEMHLTRCLKSFETEIRKEIRKEEREK